MQISKDRMNFAAKPFNRRGLKFDAALIKPLEGYDGAEIMDQRKAGQATFKVKRPNQSRGTGKRSSGLTEPIATPKTLSSDEIKSICTENNLMRGDVYQIRSKFVSMCTMSEKYMKDQGIKKDPSLMMEG